MFSSFECNGAGDFQHFGLGGAKGIVQLLKLWHPGAPKGRPQLSFSDRLLLQKKSDVGEILTIFATHHLGEEEVNGRRAEQRQACERNWYGDAPAQPIRQQE